MTTPQFDAEALIHAHVEPKGSDVQHETAIRLVQAAYALGAQQSRTLPVIKANWVGDERARYTEGQVEVLACDPMGGWGSVPSRAACWVRYWPSPESHPRYMSCDLCDLELSDEDFSLLADMPRDTDAEETEHDRRFGVYAKWRDPEQSVPEGFVVVPVEPTDAMIMAGMTAPSSASEATNSLDRAKVLTAAIYRAMLAARGV